MRAVKKRKLTASTERVVIQCGVARIAPLVTWDKIPKEERVQLSMVESRY
jgi:hypothetical protein